MNRQKGVLVLVGVIGMLVYSSGCGGASDADIQQAREDGAKEVRQAEKLKEIQQGIASLKRQKRRGSFRQLATPPASTSSTYTGSGPSKTCANGVGASSATSCEFAFNVAGVYASNPGSISIQAFSPVTGQDYVMTCSAWSGGGTVCRGGNDAAVFIP